MQIGSLEVESAWDGFGLGDKGKGDRVSIVFLPTVPQNDRRRGDSDA
jgi:hypothetical protein